MGVDRRVLERLVCPACQGPVRELDGDQGLECSACGRVYPIRDGIVVMLVEESRDPEEGRRR